MYELGKDKKQLKNKELRRKVDQKGPRILEEYIYKESGVPKNMAGISPMCNWTMSKKQNLNIKKKSDNNNVMFQYHKPQKKKGLQKTFFQRGGGRYSDRVYEDLKILN